MTQEEPAKPISDKFSIVLDDLSKFTIFDKNGSLGLTCLDIGLTLNSLQCFCLLIFMCCLLSQKTKSGFEKKLTSYLLEDPEADKDMQ